MKKVKFLAAGAALCALAITGCTNETDEAGIPDGKQALMTMQADTSTPQTRADYTEDATDTKKLNFSWRAKDELSVVVNGVNGNENCKLSTTETGKTASFGGKVATFSGDKTTYAFYPYSATPYVVTDGNNKEKATAALTLPNPQLYTIGGAISNSFMVGAGTASASGTDITASVNLKQVMSIVKLKITDAPAKLTSVKLKCYDAIFATTATVKMSDGTITNPSTLVKELSMNVTDNSTNNADAKEISFAIFPKKKENGKKIRIEVAYADGKVNRMEKDDIDFERNRHYTIVTSGAYAKNEYVTVGNLKIAIGNLVADGQHGAKIGAATDGGLYFQFGSLIGWAGGKSGDGTGMPTSDSPGYFFNGVGTVVPLEKDIPTTWGDPDKWTGTTGNVPAEYDPCSHYLGSEWRLPTKDEYVTLLKNNGYPNGPWKLNGSYATNDYIGLKIPAVGARRNDSGANMYVGMMGYQWSSSLSSVSDGAILFFTDSSLTPNNTYPRAYGMPVRCVQPVSN